MGSCSGSLLFVSEKSRAGVVLFRFFIDRVQSISPRSRSFDVSVAVAVVILKERVKCDVTLNLAFKQVTDRAKVTRAQGLGTTG